MDTAKLFQTGRSQAVRLPKAFRFEGNEVYIKRVGNGVLLTPKANPWQSLLESLNEFEGEIERNQPEKPDERDWGDLWK
jgi:antitoxin VapB